MSPPRFTLDNHLLEEAAHALRGRSLAWVLGPAGAGKSTVCAALVDHHRCRIIDLDAHIYGDWHRRYTRARHPANHAWTSAPSSLTFLLGMDWADYDAFQQAAFAEYVSLLAEDLATDDSEAPCVVDGGAYHPALVARVVDAPRIICLARPQTTAAEVWEADEARFAMRSYMNHRPIPTPRGVSSSRSTRRSPPPSCGRRRRWGSRC